MPCHAAVRKLHGLQPLPPPPPSHPARRPARRPPIRPTHQPTHQPPPHPTTSVQVRGVQRQAFRLAADVRRLGGVVLGLGQHLQPERMRTHCGRQVLLLPQPAALLPLPLPALLLPPLLPLLSVLVVAAAVAASCRLIRASVATALCSCQNTPSLPPPPRLLLSTTCGACCRATPHLHRFEGPVAAPNITRLQRYDPSKGETTQCDGSCSTFGYIICTRSAPPSPPPSPPLPPPSPPPPPYGAGYSSSRGGGGLSGLPACLRPVHVHARRTPVPASPVYLQHK